MTPGPIRLPRWPITRLKLLDMTPDQKGAPYAGAPVTLLQRDGFVEGRSLLWLSAPRRSSGHLGESPDEHGQPALTISDPLFRAVMPVDAPRPFVLAGFHMSFLRRVLGGPQDRPPHDLCLYRLARQRASWLRPCGLQESVLELRTDLMTELTQDSPFLRLHCATALLETLLEWEPLNRLLVLSGNVVSPPPGEKEPFGQAAEWACLPQGPAMLED